MMYQLNNTKIQFHMVDSFNAGGWDDAYNETLYKVFYTMKKSFIYNLKDNKRIYFSFTDFDPFIISEKKGSIFLFKRGNNLSKREETTLFRYNIENGELVDTYDLFQHFINIERFELIKIDYVNDDLAILMQNYDSATFGIIILNVKTKKSIFVEVGKNMIVDTYQKNTLFVFEGELYIPYIVKENKRGLLAWLCRRNSVLKDQGILKYKNRKLEKLKSLDTENVYNIFSDYYGNYLACIQSIGRIYHVNVYYHKECILKQKYVLKRKEHISFKFCIDDNNNALFVVELKQKYEIFNLVNKTVVYIDLTEEQKERSFMLSNNIILFDEKVYDIYSNKRIRNLYKFEL